MNQKKTLASVPAGMRMAVARLAAGEYMPYFSVELEQLVPLASEAKLPAPMLVTEGGVVIYSPAAMAEWTAPEAAGVILHEYLHVFLNHAGRFRALVKRGMAQLTQECMQEWNEAADAEINDDLLEAGLPLPGNPVTPKDLGAPEHLTAEQYFAHIQERKKRGGKGGGRQPKGNAPGWGCGSGAGNPQPQEPPEAEQLGRDEVSQGVSRQAAAERVEQAVQSRGNVPAGLKAYVGELLQPAKIPWQDELRSEALDAAAFVAGAGDYTFSQRAREQSALEQLYGEDAPVLQGEHEPVAKVAVVFDTSGSVPDDELTRFAEETQGVLDCLGGMSVTFLSCDAAVHALAEVTQVSELARHIKGRGGTDFRPAFEALGKLAQKPDFVVFMTDGYGPAPEEKPDWLGGMVWLLTPGGQAPVGWGKVIQMEPLE